MSRPRPWLQVKEVGRLPECEGLLSLERDPKWLVIMNTYVDRVSVDPSDCHNLKRHLDIKQFKLVSHGAIVIISLLLRYD